MSKVAPPVIRATALGKSFGKGKLQVEVLHALNLAIEPSELVAIVGPSGSGKSTLLHLLGGLDLPTVGRVEVNGIDLAHLSAKAKGELRNHCLGFVYQFHHLLPEFTALENVALPLLMRPTKIKRVSHQAQEMLTRVGLAQRLHHRIGELSGGERQRVAIARALVTQPQCVLADEPTGNLDHKTALQIYDTIMELNHELKTAFVIVTHDLTMGHKMERVLVLEDGSFL